MKKISWATHKSLFGQIASSACLIGASAGIVFGVSAGTFKIRYFSLDSADARVASCNVQQTNYTSQNIASQWNMYETLNNKGEVAIPGLEQPKTKTIKGTTWWQDCHEQSIPLFSVDKGCNPEAMGLSDAKSETWATNPANKTKKENRMKYSTLVIDGATHTAMDRSFNQGLYNGIANFTQNYDHDVTVEGQGEVLKPAQDNTQEFVNIYRAAAAKTRILCLAGFNHVTPINALGKRNGATFKFADDSIKSTGMMLMDGDVANNQNVASVLFRSDQPAFLTALATCMYFYNNIDQYHQGYKDLSVGAYGGTAIPTVVIYLGGFQRGIEFFNEFVLKQQIVDHMADSYMHNPVQADNIFYKNLLPASKHKDTIAAISQMAEGSAKEEAITKMKTLLYQEYSIKMIKLGAFGTHFSGSFASGDAIGISKQFLNRGASAIIAVAGPQSLDTAQEIMNQNKNCIVIGVDSAMERSDYQKPFKNPAFKDKSVGHEEGTEKSKSAQAGNIIKFSAVKDMTSVSDKMLRLAAAGEQYDVVSTTPWLTRAVTPTLSKDKQTSEDDLAYSWNDNAQTYEITGFDGTKTGNQVLALPLSKTHNDKTYRLTKVSGFKAAGLEKVEIIKFNGSLADNQTITLDKGAFTFDDTNDKKALRYIDLSNIPVSKLDVAAGTGNEPFAYLKYKTATKNNNGFIKLGAGSIDDQDTMYQKLLSSTDRDRNGGYIHEEPDPYKSICAFGYKTCGNIENGLISISWDGWAPLIQSLWEVKFFSSPVQQPGEIGVSFQDAWKAAAQKYCQDHSAELTGEYVTLVTGGDEKDLITYKKTSLLNTYYGHTTMILGYLLGHYYLDFTDNMTVQINTAGKAVKPSNTLRMSVLDWLKTNMYFIA